MRRLGIWPLGDGLTAPTRPCSAPIDAAAKILMLGVDYQTSTYVHLVEVLYWHHLRRADPQAAYPALDRPRLGDFWDATGPLTRGLVGASPCRLFAIDVYVDTLLAEVVANAERYLA